MKKGLVLGGGGLVGMGYHAGVLKALQEAGLEPAAADIIVGTSAGAIMAAYLTSGRSVDELYQDALGHGPADVSAPEAFEADVRALFTPLWSNNSERLRRLGGGLFAYLAATGSWARVAGSKVPSRRLRARFPAGLYSTSATEQRLRAELPAQWPRQDLYLAAVELYSGRRVALSSATTPPSSFVTAVLASSAIPGVFPPVRLRGRYYVDGGIAGRVSLDEAVRRGCSHITLVAPLGWRPEEGVRTLSSDLWRPVLARSLNARTINREIIAARAQGVEVLVLRPWLDELVVHGYNAMAHHDRAAVVEAARRNTMTVLEAQV
ncbi:MAG TPA: patatin-like phospholipase family protein [Actinomycetota bacterium]|nr:patatin-like phospholipase family protein [Actinomycetota bacterium]